VPLEITLSSGGDAEKLGKLGTRGASGNKGGLETPVLTAWRENLSLSGEGKPPRKKGKGAVGGKKKVVGKGRLHSINRGGWQTAGGAGQRLVKFRSG